MKPVQLLAFVLITGCFLCTRCSKRQAFPEIKPEVLVIFKDCKDQTVASRFGAVISVPGEKTVSYVDASGRLVKYGPRSIGADTLILPAYAGYAELMHLYDVEERITWLLMAGDTVFITVGAQGRPQLTSVSERNTWLYNLPFRDERAIHPNGYSTKTILNDNQFRRIDRFMKDPQQQQHFPSLFSKFSKVYVDLDMLQMQYDAYARDFSDSLALWERKGVIPAAYAGYYRRFYLGNGYSFEEINASDSLMHYVSNYRKALDYPGYQPEMKTTERFDIVAADSRLSPQVKNSILSALMDQIRIGDYGSDYPEHIVAEYAARYASVTGADPYPIEILDKPNVGTDGAYTFDLLLEDSKGKRTTLESLLSQYEGKMVYVDFWASWCAPCRCEMPAAARLRGRMERKPVVFVYLSTDKDPDAWKKAAEECGLDGDEVGSFRIVNRDAVFLEQIKLKTIPRYLLFNGQGRLVDENCLRPSANGIDALLSSQIIR